MLWFLYASFAMQTDGSLSRYNGSRIRVQVMTVLGTETVLIHLYSSQLKRRHCANRPVLSYKC